MHFTLVFVDYCCWFICLHGCFGWWGVYVLSGLLFLQNLSYRNWYFITVTVIEVSALAFALMISTASRVDGRVLRRRRASLRCSRRSSWCT